MHSPRFSSLLAALVLAFACSRPPAQAPTPESHPTTPSRSTFVNRVWQVTRSSAVATGTLYVFLSDGTLVITSAGNKPMVGSWSRSGDGLVMVEESHPYQVDILKTDADELVIRSHNPGEPVDIAMARADRISP